MAGAGKKAKPKQLIDRTTAYARDVVEGVIVAGRLVRLACQRHLNDLARDDIKFDLDEANKAFRFFEGILCLNGGEHEGKPFILQPWQAFLVGSVYGWKTLDGKRRFRSVFAEIGKGNGKSPLAGGIGLKSLLADDEPRAEVYAAATKRDQAMILFRDAVAMVEQSPHLKQAVEVTGPKGREYNLRYENSFMRPIASEDNSQSGPRPHCALIDEIHEHRTSTVIDMMHAGTKGRRQALIFEITNSGSDRASVCWEHHEYSRKVLEGLADDDSWFAFVCGLDPCDRHLKEGQIQPVEDCPQCDNWKDERHWIKANPNLGVSITLKYLREQVTKAKGMPTFEGEVRRLNFCFWTQVASRAIPAESWTACGKVINWAEFEGRDCVAGLDIGATSDFTAFTLLFPHNDDETIEIPDANGQTRQIVRRSYTVRPYFWLPESPVKRDEHTARMIESWRRAGYIRTTPGNLVDYAQVLADIREIGERHPFTKLAIDRGFQGNWIAGQLVDLYGDVVESFTQGIISMNAPFRELLELIKGGRFNHPNDPVLTWMAGNLAAETRGGLIKPSKDHSPEKIDGITAATMAMGLAATMASGSVYESRGLIMLGEEDDKQKPELESTSKWFGHDPTDDED